jgi:hypothetical protein
MNYTKRNADFKISSDTQREGLTVGSDEARRRSGIIYRASGNLFIVKEAHKTIPNQFVSTKRAAISEFSSKSVIRMRAYLRECLYEYTGMVTLTYPEYFTANGAIVKEHLHRFLQELHRHSARHDTSIESSSFWFLEFQERGAPHFHILTTIRPGKVWIASTWYRIVGSESEYHESCGTRVETIRSGRAGMASYVTKYAAKSEQKVVPLGYENVGRFWGIYGGRSTVSAVTFVASTESDQNKAKNSLKSLHSTLQLMITNGHAEVYKREYGVLVLLVHDSQHQKTVRMLVSRLACSTMRFSNMFSEAELDQDIVSTESCR